MKVCLVSPNLEERNQPLQPWRYLFEAAGALAQSGCGVYLISDGYPRLPGEGTVGGLSVIRLASLKDWPLHGNLQVVQAVTDLQPDVVFWHLGLTSFLHLDTLRRISHPVIGIFTSPIYAPRDLLRLGLLRLLQGWRLSASHIMGLLVPGALIRRALRQGLIEQLVVECETTRTSLTQRGVPNDRIHVSRPVVDPVWFERALSPAQGAPVRDRLGLSSEAFVVGYFGPPTPLRGLPILLKAVAVAREKDSRIELLALSRQRDGGSRAELRAIERLVTQLGAKQWAHVLPGFLPQKRLIRTIAACDVVVLPFEVVPSDVPLSVLEAMAMGMPVITTQVACLPELVQEAAGLCLPPGNSVTLAKGILKLVNDAEMRERLSRAGRRRAISWGAQGESADVWNRLLEGTFLDGKG